MNKKENISLENKEERKGVSPQSKYLAGKIVQLGKQEMIQKLPYFLPATLSLKVEEASDKGIDTMATNGKYLYYNAEFVIGMYKENESNITGVVLHEILHCVFRHLTRRNGRDRVLWNIATDIAINYMIRDINEEYKTIQRNKSLTEKDILTLPGGAGIEAQYDKDEKYRGLSAEEIYFKIAEEMHKIVKDMLENGADFEKGDSEEGASIEVDLEAIGIDPDSLSEEAKKALSKKLEELSESKQGSHKEWENVDDTDGENREKIDKEWAKIAGDISQKRKMDCGNQPGFFASQLDNVAKPTHNWKSVLRRFANSIKESEREDISSVDYRYLATTGLYEAAYDGDTKVVKDIVIAIDTSGSINVEMFNKFMAETVSVFKSIKSRNVKVNIFVIQCDTRITSMMHIKKLSKIDDLKNIEIRGGGGTDFVPVFEKVEELKKKKKLKNLKGMLFFTDGFGCFPNKAPSYETLWVFADQFHIDSENIPFGRYTVLNQDNL